MKLNYIYQDLQQEIKYVMAHYELVSSIKKSTSLLLFFFFIFLELVSDDLKTVRLELGIVP